MMGFQKNHYFIQQLPKGRIYSLLVFLAKCIKHFVLYIMKNIISQCMCDRMLNQKVDFYEGKHEIHPRAHICPSILIDGG
jgi:hypothetical protein